MDLEQDDIRAEFSNISNGAWTELYHSSYGKDDHSFGVYCALAPPDYREQALSEPAWDLTVTDGAPGFVTYHKAGARTTEYHRQASDDGIEPLVLVREFHGVRPSFLEISEEFRLYHNLYWDEKTSCFIKFGNDGSDQAAIEIGVDRVRVRTKLLRQYQAARKLDFLAFVDSVRWSTSGLAEVPPRIDWSTNNIRLERHSGDDRTYGRVFTRVLGTLVVPAPPMEKAGTWPFEQRDENYPEFVIGVDSDGGEIRFTSNHELLGNYFGANPDAPHYLTSVHFRREVLRKYYDNPDLYTVGDGYLRCAGLWGLHIDNDHSDRVVVFLGDLGRDLPSGERDYWLSFNIPPDTQLSETGFRRSFLAQFAEPKAADLTFRHSFDAFRPAWVSSLGWSLFRDPVGSDAHVLQQVRLPLTDSDSEFDEIVGRLAKLLCDGIDNSVLQTRLGSKVADERSIAKLNRWLESVAYPERERDIKFLRDLQELRSAVSAHAKGSKYQNVLSKVLGERRGRAAIVFLLERGELMLEGLREWATTVRDSAR